MTLPCRAADKTLAGISLVINQTGADIGIVADFDRCDEIAITAYEGMVILIVRCLILPS